MPQHSVQSLPCLHNQRGGFGFARALNSRQNPTALSEDFHVGGARCSGFEFICPITSPNQMGVRVDETRHNDSADGMNRFLSLERALQLV